MENVSLKESFEKNPKVALAFSGGTDSSYLLYEGLKSGADVLAFCVNSQFQPRFELKDASSIVSELWEKGLKAELRLIEIDVLKDDEIICNSAQRCYYCKHKMFSAIKKAAKEAGYETVIDGTNASDDADDRPGMKAIAELGILSPLRDAGICKDDVRKLSEEAGLFTCDKPSYACLATRIPEGQPITAEKLKITEKAEDMLYGMGFRDFRIRMNGRKAVVQIREDQYDRAVLMKDQILRILNGLYESVEFEVRR